MNRTHRGQNSGRGLDDTESSFRGDGTFTRTNEAGMTAQSSSPSGAAAAANGEDEFRILVATRIRPFTRKEMREWRAEQRQEWAAKQQQQQAVLARGQQRQPFGPGHDALGETGGAGLLLPDDDDQAMEPEPVMDVENDGTTVVLLDPQNPGTARGVYTYDYVFSSFAPSVDIMDIINGGADDDDEEEARRNGLNGTWAEMENPLRANNNNNNPSSPVPLAFDDEVDLTAEQEAQAEAEQRSIFCALALPLLDAAFQGVNVCIFAYGQTSSGKTYTMLGSRKHRGIMPRLCHELFRRVEEGDLTGAQASSSPSPPLRLTGTKGNRSARGEEPLGSARGGGGGGNSSSPKVRIEVSYMEIYNEQVRDLLKQRPKNAILHYNSRFDKREIDHQEYQTLKVRHHPTNGIYVEGLTTVAVHSWKECSDLLRAGSQLRTQCSTEMNQNSSRSHAIFQLVVTQTEDTGGKVRGKAVSNTRISKVNLVDLAGSERNSSSQATGKHLAEANSINVSLSTLRRVIDGLVSRKKGQVIPYRESLLTYVLSDNFGGNSRTVMCANVSPSAANLAETESTLRYATMARAVRNRVKVNENPQARLIRELKDRMRGLQTELARAPTKAQVDALELDVQESEEALQEMQRREAALQHDLDTRAAEEARLRQALDDTQRQGEAWRQEADQVKHEREQLRRLLQRVANTQPELLETSVGDELLAATGSEGFVPDDARAVAAPTKPPPRAARKRKSTVTTTGTASASAAAAAAARTRRASSIHSGVYGPTSTATTSSSTGQGASGKKKKKKRKASLGGARSSPATATAGGADDADMDDISAVRGSAASMPPPPSHLMDAYINGQPPRSPGSRRVSASEPPSARYSTGAGAGGAAKSARLSARAQKTKATAGTRLPPLHQKSHGASDGSARDDEESVGGSQPASVDDLLGPSGATTAAQPSPTPSAPTTLGSRAEAWEKQLAGLKASRVKKGTPLSLLSGSSASATPASAPSKVEQTLFEPLNGQRPPHPPSSSSSAPPTLQSPARASSGHVHRPDTYDAHVQLTRVPFSGVEDDNDLLWSTDMSQLMPVMSGAADELADSPSRGADTVAAAVGTIAPTHAQMDDDDDDALRRAENELSTVSGSTPPPCFTTTRTRVSAEGAFIALHDDVPSSGRRRVSQSLLSPYTNSVGSTELRTSLREGLGTVDGEPLFYQTETFLGGGPVEGAVAAWSPTAAASARRASVLPLHDGDPELSVTGTAAALIRPPSTSGRAAVPRASLAGSAAGLVPHPPSQRSSLAPSHTASTAPSKGLPPPLSHDALDPSAALSSLAEKEIVLSPNNGETASVTPAESPSASPPKGKGKAAKKVPSASLANGTAAGTRKAKKKKTAVASAENDV